jgi:hypothetical protein
MRSRIARPPLPRAFAKATSTTSPGPARRSTRSSPPADSLTKWRSYSAAQAFSIERTTVTSSCTVGPPADSCMHGHHGLARSRLRSSSRPNRRSRPASYILLEMRTSGPDRRRRCTRKGAPWPRAKVRQRNKRCTGVSSLSPFVQEPWSFGAKCLSRAANARACASRNAG